MFAHALLAVLTAAERRRHPYTDEMIPLTSNAIRHLFPTLTQTTRYGAEHLLRWSNCRRRQQARARVSRYCRREATIP